MTSPALSIIREAITSFGVNAMLSLVFFVATFGGPALDLGWEGSDGLALDFVPQSIAVSLMSALVPALLARRRMGLAVSIGTVIRRALGFAACGAVVGAILAAGLANAGMSSISWGSCLALKLAYGGLLGAIITSMVLQRMTR